MFETAVADPYASGVLTKERHARVVANLPNFAKDANITPDWVSRSMVGVCPEAVIDWVRRFPLHGPSGRAGLCITKASGGVLSEDIMAAVAGAFLRNTIRARLMTVTEFATAEDTSDYTVVLVPNFLTEGAKLPDWRMLELTDAMSARHMRRMQTVIAVPNLDALQKAYGVSIRKFVETKYEVVGA